MHILDLLSKRLKRVKTEGTRQSEDDGNGTCQPEILLMPSHFIFQVLNIVFRLFR